MPVRLELGQWTQAFEGLGPAFRNVARRSLRETAEVMMAASKRIVPYETGALQGSGQVGPIEESGARLTVTLGYGNAAVPYAVYVHENMAARHKPGTSAKYLERPVLELQRVLGERVQANMPGEVGR